MRISAKYKGLFYLTLLVVVLPIAGYCFALRKTIVKWNRLGDIENRIDSLRNNVVQGDITPIPQQGNIDIISDGAIINILSPITERYGVSVEKFTIYTIHNENDVKVVAAEMEISGGYKSIVRVIDFIEQKVAGCKITSLEFRTKKRERQSTYLSATILIQQIITN